MIHGRDDMNVPLTAAQGTVDALVAAGVDVEGFGSASPRPRHAAWPEPHPIDADLRGRAVTSRARHQAVDLPPVEAPLSSPRLPDPAGVRPLRAFRKG